MQVVALKNVLYRGSVYKEGAVFEMDELTAAVAKKYGTVRIIEGSLAAAEDAVKLPPVKKRG